MQLFQSFEYKSNCLPIMPAPRTQSFMFLFSYLQEKYVRSSYLDLDLFFGAFVR